VTTAMTAKTERAAAIRWIQAEMADYGLTFGTGAENFSQIGGLPRDVADF